MIGQVAGVNQDVTGGDLKGAVHAMGVAESDELYGEYIRRIAFSEAISNYLQFHVIIFYLFDTTYKDLILLQ